MNNQQKLIIIILTVIIIIAIVITFFFLRARFLANQNRKLEILIKKRTKKLEAALKRLTKSEDDLRKQSYLQERIIAAISHDLKTPLKYLTITSQILYKQLQKDHLGPLADIGKGIYNSTYKMYLTLDNLLQYIKMQMKKSYIQFEKFKPAEIIEQKFGIFQEIAATNSLELINKVPLNLEVNNSLQLFNVVIHNLIDNAIKYSNKGTIIIDYEEDNKKLAIRVTDSGIGIKEHIVEWLNSPYINEDEEKSEESASSQGGLGLIIVKDLTHLIDVELNVKSQLRKGTTFSLIFNDYAFERSQQEPLRAQSV